MTDTAKKIAYCTGCSKIVFDANGDTHTVPEPVWEDDGSVGYDPAPCGPVVHIDITAILAAHDAEKDKRLALLQSEVDRLAAEGDSLSDELVERGAELDAIKIRHALDTGGRR